MLRIGLRLLAISVVLCAVGWLSLANVVFEVIRISGIACMTVAFILLILDYVRTPEPPSS